MTDLEQEFSMLIGGRLEGSESGERFESVSPATEQVIGRPPLGGVADVDRAVHSAAQAAPEWAALSPGDRADFLLALAQRLQSKKDELAELEVRDTGLTIGIARFDVDTAVESLRYYAGLGYELKGETVPSTASHIHASLRVPFGVVGRILPFNHPLMFAASKLAAPLMAGNTIVIKPAEQSPLSTLSFGLICREVFPPGVVNVVSGFGPSAGDALVRHPAVRRLAFIGSVGTGLAIQRAAASDGIVKDVSLELGGKNPLIVYPDVDLEEAMSAVVRGMNFAWQGQSCGSTSRVFLHADLYKSGVDLIADLVREIKVGDPLDPDTGMGPINSRAQLEKNLEYVRLGKKEGARLVAGGGQPAGEMFERGFWMEPTVFADVDAEMSIFQEEIFGPVLSIIPWTDPSSMISEANGVEYGLTASVWSRDINNALSAACKVEAGYVWVNGVSSHYTGTDFGGVKNSGVGREEGLGELLSYTQSKMLHVRTGA